MKSTGRNIAARLKEHGYKLTRQRRAVIQAVASGQVQLTLADIYEQVHQALPDIGLATVYRTINILAGLGLVCDLHASGNSHSYIVSIPEHHHHLICSGCGTVIDFTGHDLSKLERRLSSETGFEIEGHVLEFTGLCRTCQKDCT